jgi:pimeloyl-ACP methyl ester carboxylesterase
MSEYRLHTIEVAPETPVVGRPPLLFVHGSGRGSWVWAEHFLSYFARNGYHCAALDLRGHGESEGRDDLPRFRLDDFAGDVANVATELVLRNMPAPVVIGHSLGGGVIERLVDQRTLSMPAAVLLAPFPRGDGWKVATRAAVKTFGFSRMARILFTHDTGLMYENADLARTAFFAADTPEELTRAYWERFQPESWMSGDMSRFAESAPLPNPEIPLLFVSGAEDKVFPSEAIKRTAEIYGGDFVEVEGVAHDMMLDTHWERAAEAILAWLNATLHATLDAS